MSLGERIAISFVDAMSGVPPWLIVLVIAALPIVELRGAIPVALVSLNMNLPEAIIFSLIGNMIPVPFILWFLGPISKFLSKWKVFERFFEWLFARTRKKSKAIERYEALGIIMFVGIPLPVTGAYTGSVAAYLFGIPFWRSVLFMFIGVCVSATIVTFVTLGAVGAVNMIGG